MKLDDIDDGRRRPSPGGTSRSTKTASAFDEIDSANKETRVFYANVVILTVRRPDVNGGERANEAKKRFLERFQGSGSFGRASGGRLATVRRLGANAKKALNGVRGELDNFGAFVILKTSEEETRRRLVDLGIATGFLNCKAKV